MHTRLFQSMVEGCPPALRAGNRALGISEWCMTALGPQQTLQNPPIHVAHLDPGFNLYSVVSIVHIRCIDGRPIA